MAGKNKTSSGTPWHEAAESQLTRLRNDRGKIVASSVETMADCAAVTLGMQQVTLQVYLAARAMVFNLMGLIDSDGPNTGTIDGGDVHWYRDRMNAGRG